MLNKKVELIRTKVEEIEYIEKAIGFVLDQKNENRKHACMNDHKIKNLTDSIQQHSKDIISIYQEQNDAISNEFDYIGALVPNPNKLDTAFYQNVQNLVEEANKSKVYHLNIIPKSENYFLENVFNPPNPTPGFSQEEHNGRCLDLQESYSNFKNISTFACIGIKSYLDFLRDFDKIVSIEEKTKAKSSTKVHTFYKELLDYLEMFYMKYQPLIDQEAFLKHINAQFEEYSKQQEKEKMEEEEKNDKGSKSKFYCKSCMKDFSNENTFVYHFSGKTHLKMSAKSMEQGKEQNDGTNEVKNASNFKNNDENKNKVELVVVKKINEMIFFIKQYANLLDEVFQNTINNIRRKSTYNADEFLEEYKEVSDEELSISDHEEDEKRSKRNLPIDSTGKPIPMWIFKMQGLGIEYKCEVCGNYSYWGRRAFEKHFTEWRHSYGMKCLRIPNSQHFFEITSINDALILHKKLLMEAEAQKFKPEMEEEVEDENGVLLIGKMKK